MSCAWTPRAGYLTADGNLQANQQVQQWLQTLPPDELDALLRSNDNGSKG